ncbi:hypothetical protein EI982_03200 [Haloplanus rallus]|uniref:Pyrrolo-quinoline quinone repeat domain-containing protein n=1 Tax=Haloplanus rallus TaxID=1816183 RepID=A0A6B9F689_9EURY|nr:PQQ-binding-like beta-propeller repeat protein [Haloplanus rallus]QGX93861.1 hypothetical protein EI982_03200 [Haloplanus rallus]
MDRRRYLALCAAGVGSLAGCGTESQNAGTNTPTGTGPTTTSPSGELAPLNGTWREYQHDAGNTGAIDDPGPIHEPVEYWTRTTTAGAPATAPAAAAGTFVVVTRSGTLYARDAEDGRVLWSGSQRVNTDVAPVAMAETIVAAADQKLLGIGGQTGERRWTLPLEDPAVGLAVDDGRVVVATESRIRAILLGEGTTAWRQPLDEPAVTPPGVGEDVVTVGLASGSVIAFAAQTGRRKWRASVGPEPTFAPALGHGNVYLGVGTRVVALAADGGDRQWQRQTDAPVAASPEVTLDAVYVTTLTDDAGPRTETPRSESTDTPTAVPTDTERFTAAVLSLAPADGSVEWRTGITETYNFTSGPPRHIPLVVADDDVVVGLGGPLHAYDATTGDRRWATDSGGVTPAVTDGVVSTGVTGLDLVDGSVRWRFGTTENVSPPAVVGNTVFVGSDDNYLYALAANTGAIRWSARTDGHIRTTPAVDEDTVYVGTMEGTLYAFDVSDGTERWTFDVGGQVQSPTLHGGTVYVGNFSPTLTAVDAADGTEAWRADVEQAGGTRFIALKTAADDAAVYTGANGDLRAFDVSDGSELWQVTSTEQRVVQSPPILVDGTVLVHMGSSLRAFDSAEGTEQWATPTGESNRPPVAREGTVYTSGDDTVYAFDASDGTGRWQTAVGGDLLLVIGDEMLYGIGYETGLLALDPSDGTISWTYDAPLTTPPAIADDYLFAGGESGTVYALGPAPQ